MLISDFKAYNVNFVLSSLLSIGLSWVFDNIGWYCSSVDNGFGLKKKTKINATALQHPTILFY